MNIYNKLFILEYSRSPSEEICFDKIWYLNLSKHKYSYAHRNFDLYSYVDTNQSYKLEYKVWYRYNRYHRLIGPAYLDSFYIKKYFLNNRLMSTLILDENSNRFIFSAD